MPELLLHYIWKKRIWAGFSQYTTDEKPIEIISIGQYNIHAGPDFSNAHIRINGQDWFGNVEIHVNASDWYKHHHHLDNAYDNTILHIVANPDKTVVNSRGEQIPQCQLQYPHNRDYLTELFQQGTIEYIPCHKQLIQEPSLLTENWKTHLLQKRLQAKYESITQLLTITQQSWAHAFYITLAHNFGFHTNGLPFEMLALQTPLSCLLKHRNSLFQITAILLGQSGLLNSTTLTTDEHSALWHEYCFLRKKFSLTPLLPSHWKKAKMRPQSAPEVRIRQFAHLLYQSEHIFAQLMDASTIKDMVDLLTLKYTDEEVYLRVQKPLPLGRKSIDILLINTVIPYKYAYTHSNIYETINYLQQIKKEDNTIIRQWTMLGQKIQNAADTQALIHLYQNYCQPHLCFHCHIGHQGFSYQQLELF